jgi:hypothetical protein
VVNRRNYWPSRKTLRIDTEPLAQFVMEAVLSLLSQLMLYKLSPFQNTDPKPNNPHVSQPFKPSRLAMSFGIFHQA